MLSTCYRAQRIYTFSWQMIMIPISTLNANICRVLPNLGNKYILSSSEKNTLYVPGNAHYLGVIAIKWRTEIFQGVPLHFLFGCFGFLFIFKCKLAAASSWSWHCSEKMLLITGLSKHMKMKYKHGH